MSARNAQPVPLSEILTAVLKKKGLSKKVKQHEIFLRWEEIVGKGVAKNAVPRRFQGNVLVVAVKAHTWMTELSYLKPKLIQKIEEKIPSIVIKDIRFIQGTPEEFKRNSERS